MAEGPKSCCLFVYIKSGCPPDAQIVRNEKKKLTVNNGLVLFSGLIHYYWPINFSEKVDRIVGKTSFFFA